MIITKFNSYFDKHGKATYLVLCIIIAALLELRTRNKYVDRGPATDEDDWSIFDDEDESENDD